VRIQVYCLVIAIAAVGLVKAADSNQDVREVLEKLFPSESVESVKTMPMGDFFEVKLSGEVVYVSKDGRYLFQGELLDLVKKTNLTQTARAQTRKEEFQKLDENSLISFGRKNINETGNIYVYTDIDCGYCRKFHLEVPALNDAGITVHYLAYPRAGLKSDSYDKAVNVWCAANKEKALSKAKAGEKIATRKCASPVADHFALGQSMKLAGTPALYSSDGTYLGAYAPAEQLIATISGLEKE
jgi:thiol:disulfide interchange protein DsbC